MRGVRVLYSAPGALQDPGMPRLLLEPRRLVMLLLELQAAVAAGSHLCFFVLKNIQKETSHFSISPSNPWCDIRP